MTQIQCPAHPGQGLLAYQQTSFATPCNLELNADGSIEIEMGERAEFERNMETTTIVCYLCTIDGCDWSILPEQLNQYREPYRPQLVPELDRRKGDGEEFSKRHPYADERGDLEEPVQRPGEDSKDFNHRRAEYHKALRQAKSQFEYRAKDPMDKFKGVFDGS